MVYYFQTMLWYIIEFITTFSKNKKVGIGMENEKYLQVVEDEELEQLVGGIGPGYIETLTKDCPRVTPQICLPINGIWTCKRCY